MNQVGSPCWRLAPGTAKSYGTSIILIMHLIRLLCLLLFGTREGVRKDVVCHRGCFII